jgi:hypothetical protein
VTPDGRYLAFMVSDGSGLAPRYEQLLCALGGNANANPTGGCSEMYVYRADSSSPSAPDLVCASCIPSGAPATASAWVNIRRGASAVAATTHLNHALTDDGRRVFFSTEEALVADDTNGKFDAYEFDVPSRTVHLLSSGKDPFDSYFIEATPDGHDAYFLTRERLLGWDTDTAYDLYDARVNGGFPEPPAPPQECGGDGCQGKAPDSPAAAGVGSSAFRGSGNARDVVRPRARRALRCKRGQVKRRVKGRTRCVRHSKAKAKHAAQQQRRAAAKRKAHK